MSLCRAAGITCISVGHRPTLRRFHDRVLHLHGDGSYSVEDETAAPQHTTARGQVSANISASTGSSPATG